MDNDDRQIGRILSRREVLALFGAAGAAVLVARASQAASAASAPAAAGMTPQSYLPLLIAPEATATPTATAVSTATATPTATPGATPTCIVRPAVTEGPYFVDEKLNRSDIRSDPSTGAVKPGALLALTFNVSKIASGSCTALSGATVDIWHCDAAGLYSDESPNNTVGQKFLRGYQVTDANGLAAFTTIYPGWYSGRAVHIHFKIRTTTSSGASYEFTSQLFFDDTLTDQVFTQAPYASKGTRDKLNSTDNIYSSQLLLTVAQTAAGYAATFNIGLNIA
jgi:protocatechuate 3,4-dioxygenase beta subunit